MIKLVASDLDGTIIDGNNGIYKTNLDAIKSLNDNNIDFAICTGKTYPIMKGVCSQFNATYGIFGNGNQIINLRTGEQIYKQFLTREHVENCIDITKKYGLHIHLYTDKEIVTENLLYMDLRNFKMKEKNPEFSLDFKIVKNIKDYINSSNQDVCKLVISGLKDLEAVREEILINNDLSVLFVNKKGKYKDNIINKEYEYLDISSKGISKSNALDVLGKHLNVNREEIMAIGDNTNDIEMVGNSGIGVAVANAYDELKKVANYTTKNPVEKGGFAEAIYKYIKF